MNDKTEQLVRELAEKLGTTVEHLWGVLVQQAPIAAATNTLLLGIAGILTALVVRTAVRLWKDGEEEAAITATFVSGLMALASFVALCCFAPAIAAGFFNPEYWALKQIIP